jgi:hypothetical protein
VKYCQLHCAEHLLGYCNVHCAHDVLQCTTHACSALATVFGAGVWTTATVAVNIVPGTCIIATLLE